MMRSLALVVPLPPGAMTENLCCLVTLCNLVDLIVIYLSQPVFANQTFQVSDGEDLSTAELLKHMGVAMSHPARLFCNPPSLLRIGATVLNKFGICQRLRGSLQLDTAKSETALGLDPTCFCGRRAALRRRGASCM